MQKPEAGFLLIADITGYTRFLTASELEHAQGILEELFSALLGRLRSPFALSNIQGDAILAHAPGSRVSDGRHVLDMVDSLYCGFSAALEHIQLNNTCTCAACSNTAALDLKLLVHHGPYVEQKIAGRAELGGPEVILIHRLLKNSIASDTGIRAYSAFTGPATTAIGLSEYFAGAAAHREQVDSFGEIELRVVDMRPIWEAYKAQHVVAIGEHDQRISEDVAIDLPIPPDRCWFYLTDPSMRGAWVPNVTKLTRMGTHRGRTTVGTEDHCAHGDGSVLVFRVVDWRPQNYVTYHMGLAMGAALPFTIFVAPTAEGCRVTVRTGLPIAPNKLVQAFFRLQSRKIGKLARANWISSLEKIADLAKADAAAGRAAQAPAPVSPDQLQAAVRSRLAPA